MIDGKPVVLFLCVANSARSQMAEALARKHFGELAIFKSAGSSPSVVNPLAIKALKEVGVDCDDLVSKSVDSIEASVIDKVITLCKEEVCPVFLGSAERLSWAMEDPATKESEHKQLENFRRTRDLINEKLNTLKF